MIVRYHRMIANHLHLMIIIWLYEVLLDTLIKFFGSNFIFKLILFITIDSTINDNPNEWIVNQT